MGAADDVRLPTVTSDSRDSYHPPLALAEDPNRLDPEPAPQNVRSRLAACPALSAPRPPTLTDATDADLIAVLGPHVLYLAGAWAGSYGGDARGVVGDQLEPALDGPDAEPIAEDRVTTGSSLAVGTLLQSRS